ncbi:MAG: tetratricopeptide repeat protein [Armatimonadia bacterium]
MARGHAVSRAIIFCLPLLLLGLQPSLSHAQQTDAQQTEFTNGVRNYQDGQYQEAAKALEAATAADPNHESAWYFLGLTRMKLLDYEGALAAFQKAVDLAPTRPGTRLMVGQIYESQNAYAQAIPVYQDELRYRRGKDILPVMNALGRSFYRAGRYTEAIAQLQRVISEDPRAVEAQYYTGLSYAALGNYVEAVKHYQIALDTLAEWRGLVRTVARLRQALATGTISPEQQRVLSQTEERLAQDFGRAHEFGTELALWPTLNKAMGNSQLALKEWSAARNAYRRALDIEMLGNPADADAYTLVALAHLTEAKSIFMDDGLIFQTVDILNDAIKEAKNATDKNPSYAPARNANGEIYLFQAKTYTSKPELKIVSHTCEDAAKEFLEALKLDPNYIPAMRNLAECLLYDNKAEEAKDYLTKALTLEPRNAALNAQMAQVLLALEDPDNAMQAAQTALLIDKNSVDALIAAGMVYMYYRDDLGEATEYYSRAVAADPRRWESYVNLGLAFFQMESWYRARREFKQALDLIPTATIANTAQQQAYLYYLIARTYHQTAMYDQEVEALNEALGRSPSHLETLRQLAMAYEAQRKFRAAEQALQQALNVSPGPQEDADINVQLGEMLEREGKLHEAIAAYSAALKSDPNSLAAQRGLDRLQRR